MEKPASAVQLEKVPPAMTSRGASNGKPAALPGVVIAASLVREGIPDPKMRDSRG